MYCATTGTFLQRDPLGQPGSADLLYSDEYVTNQMRNRKSPIDSNLYEYCRSNPTKYVDPFGLEPVSRNLTPCERQFLEYVYKAAYPAMQKNDYLKQQLPKVLANVTIWDANTISGWGTFHPENIIAQNAIQRSGADGVTLGNNQYYKDFPLQNSTLSIGLLGHETFHSLHADGTLGTIPFLVGYGVDSVGAWSEGHDPYLGNSSEIHAYAIQFTIDQILKENKGMLDCFCKGNQNTLPKDLKKHIYSVNQNNINLMYQLSK